MDPGQPQVRRGPKRVEVIADATITPFAVDRDKGTVSGCVYDSTGEIVELSRRSGGHSGDRYRSDDPQACAKPVVELPGVSLYLGHYFAHYGHFITETLSTFWALETVAYDRVLMHPFTFGSVLHDYARDSLRAFGAPDPNMIREPCRTETLIVPERLFTVNHSAHEEFIATHRRIACAFKQQGDTTHLYLSRRDATQRPITHEPVIEERFAANGWTVIHPETIPFRDQIALYSSAHALAGFSGSALHNCLFMPPNGTVIEMGDTRTRTATTLNQVLCETLSGVARKIFVPFTDTFPGDTTAIPAAVA